MLGESIAAATIAAGHAITANVTVVPLLTLAAGGLVMVLSVWWIYFDFSTGRAPSGQRTSPLATRFVSGEGRSRRTHA